MPLLIFKLFMVGVAAYTGARIYQESQFVQKKPCLTSNSHARVPLNTQLKLSTPVNGKTQDGHQNFSQNLKLEDTESHAVTLAAQIDQNLLVSGSALGLAVAGSLIYPPLSLLSIPAMIWVCLPIFGNAYQAVVKEHRVNMAVMDIVFFTGCVVSGNYFAGSLALFVFSLSRKLLHKTEDHSRLSIVNIFGVQQQTVWLLTQGVEIQTPLKALKAGDLIIVNTSEMVPVDGTIVSGVASIDQHLLTGESQPVEKEAGDQVFASTVMLSGRIIIKVEKSGTDTTAAQIGEILLRTADFKKTIQSRGEEIADRSALPTLGMGLLTLPVLGATSAVTIFNACFGVYIRVLAPLSVLSYLTLASRHGILIKDGRSLELLKEIDTVVFDKTGTLTLDQPHVGSIYPRNQFTEDEVLTFAAAAEYRQTHPIAKAILQAATDKNLRLPAADKTEYEISYGIKAHIEGFVGYHTANYLVRVGSQRYLEMEGISIPTEIKALHDKGQQLGYTYVLVSVEEKFCGMIELHTTIRPEAKRIIAQLQQLGMSIYIISGDHEQPTKRLAQTLGVNDYFAEALPEDKAKIIEQLRTQGKSICFVGDGINDSIALRKANVSFSLRGASTIATDAAQIVLMDQSLNKLIDAFKLAYDFDANMKFNTFATIIPGVMTVTGVYFLNFTIIHSVILNQLGLLAGTLSSILPLIESEPAKITADKTQQRGDDSSTKVRSISFSINTSDSFLHS